MKIKIKPIQDRQAYKDDIQSITELFHSQDEGKCSLQEYIQGWWNPTELEQTSSLLKDMGPLDNIALYKEHIEKLCPQDFKHHITVRTVDAMQGYEDDFIILDMVHGYGVGFTRQ